MVKKTELSNLFMMIRARLSKSVAQIVPPDEIEDIVQETYVRVCQFEDKREITYPRTFMFKTAKNIALDYVKRSENIVADLTENEDDFNAANLDAWDNEPYQRANSNDEFALFCSAVRALPRQCRRAFVLKKVYGFTQKEIAARLNISERTVEKHVATGITRCGRFMNKHTDYGKKVVIKRAGSSRKSALNSQQLLSDED